MIMRMTRMMVGMMTVMMTVTIGKMGMMEMVIMEKEMVFEGHLLVPLLLLIVQLYVFFQGFLGFNLRSMFATKDHKGTMDL